MTPSSREGEIEKRLELAERIGSITGLAHPAWEKDVRYLLSRIKSMEEQLAARERALGVAAEDMESDLIYRNDCAEHNTADCEVPGCEDPDECLRCLTIQRIAAIRTLTEPGSTEKKA